MSGPSVERVSRPARDFVNVLAGLLILGTWIPAATAEDAPAQDSRKAKLLALYQSDASEWRMYLNGDRKETAEFKKTPVYIWTNPTRDGGQDGAVFVWTHRGCPEVTGSIFTHAQSGLRKVDHELHALSDTKLVPIREQGKAWEPRSGLVRRPVPDAPEPASKPPARMIQMRSLLREFSAHSIDYQKEKWELRLLPQPIYRYESTRPDVLDGALFAMATSAGTDPEVMIGLEARKFEKGFRWEYYVARFSDFPLHVFYKKAEVWSTNRNFEDSIHTDPQHLYQLIEDRLIPEIQ